jgi:hypothetical protein
MLSTIGPTITASNSSAQIAALEKQLAQYEKQFQADESLGGGSPASGAELLATQITLVETEISELSGSSGGTTAASTAAAAASGQAAVSSNGALGKNIDVTA